MLRIVVTVLFLLGIAYGQTIQTQIANTNFVAPFGCNGNSNSIILTIFNGFVVETVFTVQLGYAGTDGGISTTAAVTLQPQTYSGSISVSPAIGGVINRNGVLTLIATNPIFNGGQPDVVQALPIDCGAGFGETSCGYASIPCMLRNGQFFGNFFCMIPVYVILMLAGTALLALIYVTRKKKLAEGIILGRARKSTKRDPKRQERPARRESQGYEVEMDDLVG